VVKSSEEVRAGSVLALPLHGEVRVVRVLSLPSRRGPAPEARGHYEEISGGQ
jgi:ribosome-associated heat shock protein Hsp15